MKEGNRHRFRFLSWEMSDWRDWKPQLRGLSKRIQYKTLTKAARNKEKRDLQKELSNLQNQ